MKNLRSQILKALFVAVFLTACKKQPCGCGVVDTEININYRNSTGQDLLNPLTSNYIKKDDVDLYVLVNGQKQQYYKSNLDIPENFYVTSSQDHGYYLNLFIPSSAENFIGDKVTTYLRYGDGSEDEIVGEFNQDRSRSKVLKKIWINGVLMAQENEFNALSKREFTILKN